jgi:hypothetical protein
MNADENKGSTDTGSSNKTEIKDAQVTPTTQFLTLGVVPIEY